ncbi:(3R)-3-hydroxyacyl-CoA dehydrogenase [Apteryx mantelli]|uniref:(3R)-3-hydroxyacyl-CoA dehydrogenase n=1 Tax=Apteryx mantelli TaxID=2696672 RepID=A0ABM4FYB5_9AVES
MGSAGRLSAVLALVTGGGGGIGGAVCARLAREGARVAVADGDAAAAAAVASRLARAGEHAAFGADVASAPAVAHLVADVQAHFGAPPAVCVACAGVTRDAFLLRLSEGDFDEVLRVNLKGTFLVTQAVARALVEAGAPGGSVVTVGSVVGKVGNLGQANYAAAKAGVEGLTRTCAKELARFGIRCNAVLPGFVATPMTAKVPPKVLQKFADQVPLGRLGEPQDVADVCAFLASPESSYITGASVEVTGGLFM